MLVSRGDRTDTQDHRNRLDRRRLRLAILILPRASFDAAETPLRATDLSPSTHRLENPRCCLRAPAAQCGRPPDGVAGFADRGGQQGRRVVESHLDESREFGQHRGGSDRSCRGDQAGGPHPRRKQVRGVSGRSRGHDEVTDGTSLRQTAPSSFAPLQTSCQASPPTSNVCTRSHRSATPSSPTRLRPALKSTLPTTETTGRATAPPRRGSPVLGCQSPSEGGKRGARPVSSQPAVPPNSGLFSFFPGCRSSPRPHPAGLIALQRLFTLMHETRRSFLHITEVVRAFGVRESDFQRIGGAWVYKITGESQIGRYPRPYI